MSDQKPVTHEVAEQIIETAPKALIDKLPDCLETRSARRNLDSAAEYIHRVIERIETDAGCAPT